MVHQPSPQVYPSISPSPNRQAGSETRPSRMDGMSVSITESEHPMTKPSNFDIEKFRSVLALLEGGSYEGERAAARQAANRLAEKAGLTFEQAVDICNSDSSKSVPSATATTTAGNFFHDLFNHPDFVAAKQERDRRDAAERVEVLKAFGDVEAVFADTEREALLSAAVDHLKEMTEEACSRTGEAYRYVSSLDGCDTFHDIGRVPASVIEAVTYAYDIPPDLQGVLEEYLDWGILYHRRQLFDGGEHWYWVDARICVLQDILCNRPVQNWQDMQARMDWWAETLTWGFHHPEGWEEEFRKRIMEDHKILEVQTASGVKNGRPHSRRTNRDKAAEVVELIKAFPDASTRELASKAGVSPQTVLNWKNRLEESLRTAA
jgi:hypothetical protein